MSIRRLKKWALLLTFWVALQTRWARASDVSGDTLTITGTGDIAGSTMSFGTGASGYPGWQAVYADGTPSSVSFLATRSGNVWQWWQNASGTPQLQLTLDSSNKLTIYDQASPQVAKITLDPMGASTLANSLTVNGTDNQMPSQTLTGSNSVLTRGLGDGRYLRSDAGSIQLFGASATGTSSMAMGSGSSASGNYAFAGGYQSTASGTYGAIALGYQSTASATYSSAFGPFAMATGQGATAFEGGTASGTYSIAIGFTQASGVGALAIGYSGLASGSLATTMGFGTTASGDYSTAVGQFTTAQAYNSFVIGTYNVGGGTDIAWVATDPLFEIGNGSDATHKADALIIYKNGNAAFQGTVQVPPSGDIPMFGH